MATRLSSCARLGLARLVTTAVVCGAAVLFLPSPCEAAVASDVPDAGVSVAPDAISTSQAPLPIEALTAGAALSDPDPTDDEDDDDDDGDDASPDAPAATASTSSSIDDSGEDAVITSDIELRPLAPLDGYSLRGPPSLTPDDDSTDVDDDDDDDASESSHGREFTRQLQPLVHFASHTEPARRHVHDGPQLRAP